MVLEKYEEIAGFNFEGYFLLSRGGISLQEFMPTFDEFKNMIEKEEYLGVLFVIDNIAQNIWIYQDDEVKTKKFVKSIKTERKEKKLAELTITIFANELQYDISSYKIYRALDHYEPFSQCFKYQINQYPLYQQHYLLPQFEEEEKDKASEEKALTEATANVKACANCGWILSANLTVCPKCHRSPREKFEGKKE